MAVLWSLSALAVIWFILNIWLVADLPLCHSTLVMQIPASNVSVCVAYWLQVVHKVTMLQSFLSNNGIDCTFFFFSNCGWTELILWSICNTLLNKCCKKKKKIENYDGEILEHENLERKLIGGEETWLVVELTVSKRSGLKFSAQSDGKLGLEQLSELHFDVLHQLSTAGMVIYEKFDANWSVRVRNQRWKYGDINV